MKIPSFKFSTIDIVNAVGALVIVYLVVLLGQTIKSNYDLGQQISSLRGQIALMQAQKDSLDYDVQYDKTNSALDRAARAQLGLQLPNEHVIIIPNDSASPAPQPLSTGSQPAPTRSNEQQWLDFLTGKS
jgi:cell division protein FtsB